MPVVQHLRVVERLGRGAERLDTDIVRAKEDLHPLVERLLVQASKHGLVDHLGRLLAGHGVGVVLGQADGRQEGVDEMRTEVRELQPTTVPGERHHAGHRRESESRPGFTGLRCGQLRPEPVVELVSGQSLDQAGFDFLAPSRRGSHQQGGEDALQCALGGAEAGPREGRETGSILAGHGPRLGADDRLVPLDVGLGPSRPEAGDRAIDEPRVGLGDHVVSEPQSLRDTGPPRLHEHVGLGGQREPGAGRRRSAGRPPRSLLPRCHWANAGRPAAGRRPAAPP